MSKPLRSYTVTFSTVDFAHYTAKPHAVNVQALDAEDAQEKAIDSLEALNARLGDIKSIRLI